MQYNTDYTFDELPASNTKRWVRSRKLAVIKAIDAGVLTEEDACTRYNLSPEELSSWRFMLQEFGPDALKTTHLKQYRDQYIDHQNFQIIATDTAQPHSEHNPAS